MYIKDNGEHIVITIPKKQVFPHVPAEGTLDEFELKCLYAPTTDIQGISSDTNVRIQATVSATPEMVATEDVSPLVSLIQEDNA